MNMKKILSLLLAAALACSMCGCESDFAQINDALTQAAESIRESRDALAGNEEIADIESPDDNFDAGSEENTAVDYTGGKPWIASNIKSNVTEDMETSPKDDFYLYVNKDWTLNAEIPEGMTTNGPFIDLYYTVMDNAKSILTDPSLSGDDVVMVQSLYNAVLDWDQRDAAGMDPIRPALESLRSINSIEEMSEIICNADEAFLISTPVSFWNTVNLNDATSYIFEVDTNGFLLGDAAEYTNRTAMGDRYYEATKKATIALLKKLDIDEDEAIKMFDDTISFEGDIAKFAYTSEEEMDPSFYSKINNIMSLDEVKELLGDYPLEREMNAFGFKGVKQCMVPQPAVLEAISGLYSNENLDALKSYMFVQTILSCGKILDREAYEIMTNYSNDLMGSQGIKPDEDMAYDVVKGLLYEPLARAYMQKFDASKTKENITEICENIIAAYKEMLKEEDWMTEETREKAIEKLDNIKINAVYPEKWTDMSSLNFDGLSYFDMQIAYSKYAIEDNAKKTNGKVDKDLWNVDILDQNAYYNSQNNSINIILGFLGDEYYSDDFSKEQMYAAIGSIIGHEISHAFDPNGSQFDKDGNMVMWWTDEDYEAFQARADKLIAYYDNIEVYKDTFANGNNFQTEAVADMAGLKVVLRIAAEQDDFDYDKFFTQYATIYRRINTPELDEYCLKQDTHPLHYMRVNCAVHQFDEFLDQYDVREGDNMYLAPEDRVLVW